jgi:hypothetical protein
MQVILKLKDYQRWLEPGDPQHLPVDLLNALKGKQVE